MARVRIENDRSDCDNNQMAVIPKKFIAQRHRICNVIPHPLLLLNEGYLVNRNSGLPRAQELLISLIDVKSNQNVMINKLIKGYRSYDQIILKVFPKHCQHFPNVPRKCPQTSSSTCPPFGKTSKNCLQTLSRNNCSIVARGNRWQEGSIWCSRLDRNLPDNKQT